jgi:hypothetical protein
MAMAADPAQAESQPGVLDEIDRGRMYFWDSSTFLGTGTLSASGTATFSTSALGPGEHYIMASYQGDPNLTGSSSPALNLVVDQDTTSTGLSMSASPGLAGRPITLTALRHQIDVLRLHPMLKRDLQVGLVGLHTPAELSHS